MQWLLTFLRFGIVGTTGMCIDFGITWLCREKLHINKYIANTLGFSFAVVNNFFWNRVWTFESKTRQWQPQFYKFLLIAVMGLLLNNLLLYFFNEKKTIPFYWAKALAIVCVFVWNFTANFLFTFQ